ncbi:MAG TPA: hypothetical protein DEO70_14145 [Bacteroidales bacterium]|nr:MAG: hypothetical protein A2X11_13530 [Bacteroidetes bacterium GWE2_42_24]HBZ67971.1 hypothetical protein [Bacteroidales bacterium]
MAIGRSTCFKPGFGPHSWIHYRNNEEGKLLRILVKILDPNMFILQNATSRMVLPMLVVLNSKMRFCSS